MSNGFLDFRHSSVGRVGPFLNNSARFYKFPTIARCGSVAQRRWTYVGRVKAAAVTTRSNRSNAASATTPGNFGLTFVDEGRPEHVRKWREWRFRVLRNGWNDYRVIITIIIVTTIDDNTVPLLRRASRVHRSRRSGRAHVTTYIIYGRHVRVIMLSELLLLRRYLPAKPRSRAHTRAPKTQNS